MLMIAHLKRNIKRPQTDPEMFFQIDANIKPGKVLNQIQSGGQNVQE